MHVYTENTRVKIHAQSMYAFIGHRQCIIHIHNTSNHTPAQVQTLVSSESQLAFDYYQVYVCGRVHIFACVQVCTPYILHSYIVCVFAFVFVFVRVVFEC